MIDVDLKYLDTLSSRLQKFKRIKNGLYNCRCPICGDSQKNKNKARGYFYSIRSDLNFKCHNCGVNISFKNFLYKIDENLYQRYYFEKFKSSVFGEKKEIKVISTKKIIKPSLPRRLNIPFACGNETAKKYLEGRKLNSRRFYYCPSFKKWINEIKKDTFENTNYDEPRIIIPLFYGGDLVGVQGRSLRVNGNKYITIMFSSDAPKVYNYDNVIINQPVYILEGPFDSEFVNNSIAMCGSDLNPMDMHLRDVVWVFDNEPRNKEIVDKMEDKINNDQKIVIWPSDIFEKDINELIINGNTKKEVNEILTNNVYSGLKAKLKFNFWKKYDRRDQGSKKKWHDRDT